jgi:hypothetical protein
MTGMTISPAVVACGCGACRRAVGWCGWTGGAAGRGVCGRSCGGRPRMPRSYPPEFRRKVLDLVKAGRPGLHVAADLQMPSQTVYVRLRQDRIDAGAGETVGLLFGEDIRLDRADGDRRNAGDRPPDATDLLHGQEHGDSAPAVPTRRRPISPPRRSVLSHRRRRVAVTCGRGEPRCPVRPPPGPRPGNATDAGRDAPCGGMTGQPGGLAVTWDSTTAAGGCRSCVLRQGDR